MKKKEQREKSLQKREIVEKRIKETINKKEDYLERQKHDI